MTKSSPHLPIAPRINIVNCIEFI